MWTGLVARNTDQFWPVVGMKRGLLLRELGCISWPASVRTLNSRTLGNICFVRLSNLTLRKDPLALQTSSFSMIWVQGQSEIKNGQ